MRQTNSDKLVVTERINATNRLDVTDKLNAMERLHATDITDRLDSQTQQTDSKE